MAVMASHKQGPSVGTLGMFIIDTFKYIDPTTEQDLGDQGKGERLGGGGLYFAIGARMWLEPSRISMVIDRGTDFQSEWQTALDAYARCALPAQCASSQTTSPRLWKWRDRTGTGELTTRAVNIYRGEQRGFDYLTPKLRLDPVDLADAVSGRLPAYLHCICSPDRASVICDQVDQLDLRAYGQKGVTKVCWEPIPDSAQAENLPQCLDVMKRIHLISPNHEEAASFLSVDADAVAVPATSLTVEEAQRRRTLHLQHLAHGFRKKFAEITAQARFPTIVIRCGAAGSVGLTVLSNSNSSADAGQEHVEASIPAWHGAAEASRVADVTGGGNSFLGGFVAYLASHPEDCLTSAASLQRALQWGAVSASYIIEQLGLPLLEAAGPDEEQWNGETAGSRLARYHCA